MASQLGSDLLITALDLTANTSTQQHNLGERAVTNDGRAFRYVKAGASDLVPGKLQQSPAEITNHENLTPSAASVGDTSITVTLGATLATANQYANGWAVVTVTPGQGYQYKIKSHPAAAQSASLTLQLVDPIQVALTTSSRIDLVQNPYSGVILNPATATSAPIGVAVYPITASQYGWVQVGGPASVLADGAVTVGNLVVASNGTAGAVENAVNASTEAQAVVGCALTGIATTEYGLVDLLLD